MIADGREGVELSLGHVEFVGPWDTQRQLGIQGCRGNRSWREWTERKEKSQKGRQESSSLLVGCTDSGMQKRNG